MNLQPRPIDSPEINLTALIDVIFLILVFLLISTTFTSQSALEVNLPSATSDETVQPSDIVVGINQAGEIRIDGAPLAQASPTQVKAALAQALAQRPSGQSRVVIRADGDSAHRLVTRVLASAGALGLQDVAIATQEQP